VRELARLCAATEREVAHDLAVLRKESLLSFSETEIKAGGELIPEAHDIASLVRSPAQPVPVPRAVLRFLARERRQSVSKAMIAYMLRGLTISRRGAEVAGRGSAKLAWVCAVTGLSERGARYARKELIRLGWIERDTGSHQWKLNRDGAYFAINLDWSAPVTAGESEAATLVKTAPLPPANHPVFAPPIKDRKTPYGSRSQKADAGVSAKQRRGGKIAGASPSLRNVTTHDLLHFDRCEVLYWQAVGEGTLVHSESMALNFLAAAVRARSVKTGDPAKVFVGILRRRLWHHVTAEQEEVARRALNRFREQNPERFRIPSDREAA
jgi:hypothetical protein